YLVYLEETKIYGFFGNFSNTEPDLGDEVVIREGYTEMAGFSDYRGFPQNPPDLYQNRFGYNLDYHASSGQNLAYSQRDSGGFGDSEISGVPQDTVSSFPQRRNLHLNFNSASSNNSPDSPDDSTGKSLVYRGVGLVGLLTDHLLSHPLLVLRRQCQVHVQSSRYHLLPVTLIYPAFQICQWQGMSVLWKGLGSTLVVKGMTLAVEDVTSKITPWPKEVSRHGSLKSFMQHILLKSVSLAVITPFYSASLVETVQSEVASETAGFFDVFREGFWRLLAWPSTGRMVPLHILVIPTVAHGILSYIIYASIKSVSLSTIKRVRESKERKQGALSKDSNVSYYMEMTASLIGHMVADVLLFPLETILHRLHLQGTRTIIDSLDTGLEVTPIITSYNGVLDCVRTTVEEEGFSGLYKGFGALILQYGLGTSNPAVHQSRSEPLISRASPPAVRSPKREMYREFSNPGRQESTVPDVYDGSPRPRFSRYDSISPDPLAKPRLY
ncbi:unnamed protein product, partial [Allacma fusca]